MNDKYQFRVGIKKHMDGVGIKKHMDAYWYFHFFITHLKPYADAESSCAVVMNVDGV